MIRTTLMTTLLIIAILAAGCGPSSKKYSVPERQQMIDSLTRGDKVVTIGGLYGEVQDVHEDKIVLRIAENLKVEVAKSAISGKRT